ncbi:hypothetical protein E2C01_097880 [Portunus trituberculatus]|uniref:Uncharacterized protein n=1 Tax=Portunus trituberculatus TaxID=210409 RepID=A0A5B7K6T9_PORTR|nr:hypothetical protein [Portunus trituberculatus]
MGQMQQGVGVGGVQGAVVRLRGKQQLLGRQHHGGRRAVTRPHQPVAARLCGAPRVRHTHARTHTLNMT